MKVLLKVECGEDGSIEYFVLDNILYKYTFIPDVVTPDRFSYYDMINHGWIRILEEKRLVYIRKYLNIINDIGGYPIYEDKNDGWGFPDHTQIILGLYREYIRECNLNIIIDETNL